MIARAVELGVASLVARWMLDGHAAALLDRVAAAGALPDDEIAALRASTRARLEKVRDEGAPYAELLGEAVGAVLRRSPGPLAETVASLRPAVEALLRARAGAGAGHQAAAASEPPP